MCMCMIICIYLSVNVYVKKNMLYLYLGNENWEMTKDRPWGNGMNTCSVTIVEGNQNP